MEEENKTIEVVVKEKKNKWAVVRLILGIISLVLVVLITFQSCAASIGEALSDSDGVNGAAGYLVALCFLVSGFVMIVARKSEGKVAAIISCAFCWIAFLLSRFFSEYYGDLKVWGIVAFAFGTVYLLSSMKSLKGYLISAGIATVYLIAGLI